jgi:hypothetical protein
MHPKLDKDILYPSDKSPTAGRETGSGRKWFPFGCGPASGTSYVIENRGEVSEDEENYASYQKYVL